tara:strand:+ start:257 stop:436 length:180 start_codon:yes stop_codon:yes gene_type:complete
MENITLFKNWETKELSDHLYFLEDKVWTTRTHYQIHAIKKILKDRKNFENKLNLYKDFI